MNLFKKTRSLQKQIESAPAAVDTASIEENENRINELETELASYKERWEVREEVINNYSQEILLR